MSKILYIAAGCSVAALVLGISLRQKPPRSQPIPPRATLQERWGTHPEIRIIKTDKIVPPVIEPIKKLEPEPEPIELPKRKVKRERTSERINDGICRAHNMRKVYVSRYRWRCKR